MKQYLMDVEGFAENDVLVLADDTASRSSHYHDKPTRKKLIAALRRMAKQSRNGDAVVVYYAGRIGRGVRNNDKSRTSHSATIPLDAERAGPIPSDDCTNLVACLYWYEIAPIAPLSHTQICFSL
jgi:Caspase domain